MNLTPDEHHELADLVDQLIAAKDDNVYWLAPIRETCLELRERLARLLDNDSSPGATVPPP